MKLQLVKPSAAMSIGLLLNAPTAYFLLTAVLKYVFGWPALFDATEPLLNSLGIKKSVGWNINLLILFGPLLAFLMNLTSILTFQWHRTDEEISLHLSFQRKIGNWVVLAISATCLAILFLYAIGENCHCG